MDLDKVNKLISNMDAVIKNFEAGIYKDAEQALAEIEELKQQIPGVFNTETNPDMKGKLIGEILFRQMKIGYWMTILTGQVSMSFDEYLSREVSELTNDLHIQ